MGRFAYKQYSLAHGVKKVKTKTGLILSAAVIALGAGGGLSLSLISGANAATPTWNLNGNYTLDFEYQGGHYVHDATITGQNSAGNFTVSGGNPVGAHVYEWNGTGNVTGNAVTFSVNYTASADAAGTHMDMTGTVAPNGTLSGTWNDNYQDGARSGSWSTATGAAHQESQVIVTPTNTQGWSTADTRPGGAVTYVVDSTAPGDPHVGALQLTTDATNAAKAQYLHTASGSLASVNELSYSTKQNSGAPTADASYQLAVDLNGAAAGGFTNLVYEPYWNGTVTPGVWQNWDVDAGQLWSSSTFSDGACSVVNGAGGPPFYSLTALKTACPDAVVQGFGVNVGTYNPSYNVEADLVNFNGTIYNFEPYQVVGTDKEACKNDGWKSLADANGKAFKNQGSCVSYVVAKS